MKNEKISQTRKIVKKITPQSILCSRRVVLARSRRTLSNDNSSEAPAFRALFIYLLFNYCAVLLAFTRAGISFFVVTAKCQLILNTRFIQYYVAILIYCKLFSLCLVFLYMIWSFKYQSIENSSCGPAENLQIPILIAYSWATRIKCCHLLL